MTSQSSFPIISMIDTLIRDVGGFGKGQAWILFVSTWSCVVAATNHISLLYLGATPSFRCAETENETCHCPSQEFVFDQSEFQSTLVTQWNLVCHRSLLLPMIQGTYFGGVIAGNLLGGPLSDVLGRRKALLGFSTLLFIFSHSLAFISDYVLYLCARFIVGGSVHALFAIYSIVLIEVVPKVHRTKSQTVLQMGWITGNAVLAVLGYFLRGVGSLQVGIALVNLPLACVYFCFPESPRWLMATGRYEEARDVFSWLAKWNGVENMGDFNKNWSEAMKNEHPSERLTWGRHVRSMLHQIRMIMASSLARTRFLLSFYPWFVSGLSYYGIFLSVKFTKVNKYTLVLISCLTEIPVLIGITWIANKVGRVLTLISAFIVCGILGLALLVTPPEPAWIQPLLIVAGKCVACIFWLCCGLHTSEMFPTPIRNAAFCFLDASSKSGAALAPFIVDILAGFNPVFPNAMMGTLTLLAFVPYLFLPETFNADIPNNIQGMKKMDDILALRLFCGKKEQKRQSIPLDSL